MVGVSERRQLAAKWVVALQISATAVVAVAMLWLLLPIGYAKEWAWQPEALEGAGGLVLGYLRIILGCGLVAAGAVYLRSRRTIHPRIWTVLYVLTLVALVFALPWIVVGGVLAL